MNRLSLLQEDFEFVLKSSCKCIVLWKFYLYNSGYIVLMFDRYCRFSRLISAQL